MELNSSVPETPDKLMEPPDSEAGLLPQPPLVVMGEAGGAPELDVLSATRLLWDHRHKIAKVTAIGFLFAVALAFLLPTRYESTARLMPPDSKSSSSVMELLSSTGQGNSVLAPLANLLPGSSNSAIFAGILNSRTARQHLIDRFDLRHVYRVRYDEDAQKKLSSRTDVTIEPKSGIISVTVTDGDPHRAADLARAYVEELDNLSAQLTTSAAHRERVFIEGRLKVVKQELDQASRDLGQFSSKNATLDITTQGRAMLEGAAVVEGQLIAAQSQLSSLEQIYTPNNARVRALRAQVEELRRQLNKLQGSEGAAPEQSSDFPSLRRLPQLAVQYSDLYRKAKIDETVYEYLSKQYELAKVQEAKEIPTVRLLDKPVVPEKKSFPPRALIICLLTVLVFLGALGCDLAVAGWERVDPADERKLFFSEVLGTCKQGARRTLVRLRRPLLRR